MIFEQTELAGVFVVTPEWIADDRGFFARSFCRAVFEERGLTPAVAQCNISFNKRKGTLRGMHYQIEPKAECKLIRCTRGSIFDVAVDIRPQSPTRFQWVGRRLSAEQRNMLYVPAGFAHGYQALEDDTEIFYQVSEFYSPQHERGLRWDDPALAIEWPLAEPIVSPRDAGHPLLSAER